MPYKNKQDQINNHIRYYSKNKDKILKYHKMYYNKNKEIMRKKAEHYRNIPEIKKHIIERNKKYVSLPHIKQHIRTYHQEYQKKNYKKYYLLNKKDISKRHKKYWIKNRLKLLNRNAIWCANNRESINRYRYKKYNTVPKFNAQMRLMCSVRRALKTYTHTGKIIHAREYGIDYEKIIKHLLKNKPENVSLKELMNGKRWHIDHIKPLCSFDFNSLEEIKKAFTPENHQWLTAQENMKKGGKY